MNLEATAYPSFTCRGVDRPSPILPMRIQRYLGGLLAHSYFQEDAEQDAKIRFADLLHRLDVNLDRADVFDDDEIRRLMLAVTPALRRFALSLTHNPTSAEDLVQNTLLRAWKNRITFALGSNFEAWTFTILRNQFYSDRRKQREVQDDEGVHAARLVSLPEQMGRLDLQDFQKALDKISPVMREALMLVTVENKSYEEAAEIMCCQIGTVKSRASRARIQLARILGYIDGNGRSDGVMLSIFMHTDNNDD